MTAEPRLQRPTRRPVLLLLLIAAAGCASGPPAPPPAPASPTLLDVPVTREEERRAAALVGEARAALEAGDAVRARALAEEVVEVHPGTQASSAALLLAARAAAALGDDEAARAHAERYAGLFPPDAAEAHAALLLLAELEERARVRAEAAAAEVVVGALLPRSGELAPYAERVLEGARLAADAFEASTGRPARLVVRDHGGVLARLPELVRSLEEEGAVGIVGPLLSEALVAAAAARSTPDLPLVSPTASEVPAAARTYTLNAPGVAAARALAEHAAAAGVRSAAVLHPATAEGRRQTEAFVARAGRLGLPVVAQVAYDSGTASFGVPIARLREAAPEALFLPVPERDVPQLAPQLAVFWLKAALLDAPDSVGSDSVVRPAPELPRVLLLGDEAWASPSVRRAVDPALLDEIVVALPLEAPSAGGARGDFAERYATAYKRTLDNPYPALGHDAALLLLSAAARGATLAELGAVEGATGRLRVVEGLIEREPVLARIVRGSVVAVEAPAGREEGR